jgi:hypothetical protein
MHHCTSMALDRILLMFFAKPFAEAILLLSNVLNSEVQAVTGDPATSQRTVWIADKQPVPREACVLHNSR